MEQAVTNWNEYPHVNEVERLNPSDLTCMEELRDVLLRHGKLDRFGVTLLHHHFSLNEDEILVESCDEEQRTLTIRPEPRASISHEAALQTSWELKEGGPIMVCNAVCRQDGKGNHSGDHVYIR
jgi:hypothetical protein